MGHYTANLRDIEFVLFDLLGRDKVMGQGPFAEIDRPTAMGMLEEVKRLAENELADSFVIGDREGARFDKETGNVYLPAEFKKSYDAYVEGGWWHVDAPAALGGIVIPPSVRWAIAEMVLGSNPAIHIYASGSSFSQVLYELGKRNGIYVTNIESKMGLNVSSTCEVSMGEKEPCVGLLLGEVHNGIAQMFKVIEFARMMVGTKAISTLSAGYQQALAYAKTRVQGPDMTKMTDKASPRVTIINHPDVRRSLITQKAYAEGMRALVLYTASLQDDIVLAEAAGEDTSQLVAMNDLMLPIVKGFGSERAWVLLGTESLQTFGGAGFTQDWPLEQYVRDAKIDTLYEGTTAIQGMDFFFRKIVRDKGQALGIIAMQVSEFAKADNGSGFLSVERNLLSKALEDVQAIIGTLVGHAMMSQTEPKEIYKVGLNTSRLLLATGDLVTSWLLLRQAEIAQAKLADANSRDKSFYEGKIAAAKFFAATYLPPIAAQRIVAETTDNSIMEISEAAF